MSSTQHPGCPICPQQRLRRRILISTFRTIIPNRTCTGPGCLHNILNDLNSPAIISSRVFILFDRHTLTWVSSNSEISQPSVRYGVGELTSTPNQASSKLFNSWSEVQV